jgi:hypothetical protein
MSVFKGGLGRSSNRPSGIDLIRRPAAASTSGCAANKRSSANETPVNPATPRNRRRLVRTGSIIASVDD